MELWLAEIRNPSWSHVHSPQFTPVAASETRHVNELNFCVSVYYYVGECVCVWVESTFLLDSFLCTQKNTQQCLSAVKNCVARLTAPAWNFFTQGFLVWKVALGFISIYIYEVCLSWTKRSTQPKRAKAHHLFTND